MQIIWTEPAVTDLERIHAYVSRDHPEAAPGLISRIIKTVEKLSAQPRMGHQGRRLGTSEFVVADTPYIIVYRVRHEAVRILRVLHGRRRV